ncbi:hypothetical protein [Aporhodopirellula aestuarii]|nr:hypothetical protein [Aporhodopirellula aestuarii]
MQRLIFAWPDLTGLFVDSAADAALRTEPNVLHILTDDFTGKP